MDQQKVVCFWFFFFYALFFIPADVSFVLGGRGAAEELGMQRAGGISWAQDAQELSSGRRISRGSVITPCPLWGWEFQGLVPVGSGEHREEMPERNVNCALHLPQSSWDWDGLSKPYEIKMSQPVMCHEGKRNHNLKKKILGSTRREPPRNMERVYLKGEEWEKCFVIKCKEGLCESSVFIPCASVFLQYSFGLCIFLEVVVWCKHGFMPCFMILNSKIMQGGGNWDKFWFCCPASIECLFRRTS